ncbi:MAG: ribosome biogenesis GTPase Der [Myxococcaceae bacterium]|nr:ribosome biogenesis GTPase Der [Myxococcaceae bacterium]MCI0671775.1 ribosome biogenesis GTPase Der [Myxococcaceae bacterium]
MRSLVAIVGRPNVGKSTLFNRLVRRRLALVEDVPGVTRDRNYADTEWGDRAFTVIDTGGFVPGEQDALLSHVRGQAELAVEECDAILLVADARAGLTPVDEEIARVLRLSGKPVLVAANKIDSPKGDQQALAAEFFALGLGDVFPVSAEHGLGMEALVGRLIDVLPKPPPEEARPMKGEEGEEGEGEAAEQPIRVAIIGRPNVGKSTLVNALLGEERVVASEAPGTTRDPIDSELEHGGKQFILTDTAGIRRRKTIEQRIEMYSIVAALKTLERSDVAVLLLDATEPGVDQDAKLAGIAEEKGRALVIVVNKWDQIEKDKRKEEAFRAELKYRFKFVAYAPVLFTSALTGARVKKVLDVAAQLAEQFRYRAPTPQLNRLLAQMVDSNPAPIVDGRPLRLYYIAQVGVAPPTFALTCNRPQKVPDMYKRYISNQLRSTFDLRVPLRLLFRERPGQAKRAARKNPSKASPRPRRRER